ncbi:MAG TPA: mycofactocin biosynthesis chaperone MftB [Anaeromyxobacter sp.]
MRSYVLDPHCQVRVERFGLLFYDLRGPRLLFAQTGGLLRPEALRDGVVVERALAGRPPFERASIERLLQSLVVKGFLREQSLC